MTDSAFSCDREQEQTFAKDGNSPGCDHTSASAFIELSARDLWRLQSDRQVGR